MNKYLPYVFTLFLTAGFSAAACADGIINDYYGQRIGEADTRAETNRNDDFAGHLFTPDSAKTGREIVIDKNGRRIGLAIPNFHGEKNNHLLRLRSGKRVGNQIFDSAGRRVGTIIMK